MDFVAKLSAPGIGSQPSDAHKGRDSSLLLVGSWRCWTRSCGSRNEGRLRDRGVASLWSRTNNHNEPIKKKKKKQLLNFVPTRVFFFCKYIFVLEMCGSPKNLQPIDAKVECFSLFLVPLTCQYGPRQVQVQLDLRLRKFIIMTKEPCSPTFGLQSWVMTLTVRLSSKWKGHQGGANSFSWNPHWQRQIFMSHAENLQIRPLFIQQPWSCVWLWASSKFFWRNDLSHHAK